MPVTINLNNVETTTNKSDSYTVSSTTTYANTKALVDGLATKKFHLELKGLNFSPNDSTSYYFALDEAPNTSATLFRYYTPNSIVITGATVLFIVNTTLGSTEQSSIYIRVDNTTDYLISATTQQNATNNLFTNNSLNVGVNAGSYFNIKWTTPAWATNPTNMQMIVILEAKNA